MMNLAQFTMNESGVKAFRGGTVRDRRVRGALGLGSFKKLKKLVELKLVMENELG